jgi:hypothetical protein
MFLEFRILNELLTFDVLRDTYENQENKELWES